jgi:Pentapeptide repeats (8 copies)
VDPQQRPRWRPTSRQVRVGVVVGVLVAVLLLTNYFFIRQSAWEWLKLLVVPAVLAAGGLWFNRQQRERELTIARQQREQELEIAERRAQDEALQAYLDQMSNMLLPNQDQPSLYKARPGDSLSSVARARTLSVLPRLNGDRKARVVQFLYESGLIAAERRVLDLRGSDLREADLVLTDLSGADLFAAKLSKAKLSGARLIGAFLREADLSAADLSGAREWTEEQLRATFSLEGATMPNGQKYEDWLKDREGSEKDGKQE